MVDLFLKPFLVDFSIFKLALNFGILSLKLVKIGVDFNFIIFKTASACNVFFDWLKRKYKKKDTVHLKNRNDKFCRMTTYFLTYFPSQSCNFSLMTWSFSCRDKLTSRISNFCSFSSFTNFRRSSSKEFFSLRSCVIWLSRSFTLAWVLKSSSWAVSSSLLFSPSSP